MSNDKPCKCIVISSPNLAAMWGCCDCNTGNGMQRAVCKVCLHKPTSRQVKEYQDQVVEKMREENVNRFVNMSLRISSGMESNTRIALQRGGKNLNYALNEAESGANYLTHIMNFMWEKEVHLTAIPYFKAAIKAIERCQVDLEKELKRLANPHAIQVIDLTRS